MKNTIIRALFLDDQEKLWKSQMDDFGEVIKNIIEKSPVENHYINWESQTRKLSIDNNIIIFDYLYVDFIPQKEGEAGLKRTVDKIADKVDQCSDGLKADVVVAVVDLCLHGGSVAPFELFKEIKKVKRISEVMVTTGWDNFMEYMGNRKEYDFEKEGILYYFRAVNHEKEELKWLDRDNGTYKYGEAVESDISNSALKSIIGKMIDSDIINLKYFATILFTVGKALRREEE